MRHKDAQWNVGNDASNVSYDAAQLAVLMDIRDELKELNRTMNCSNTRAGFLALRRIDKRLMQRFKLRSMSRKEKRP